MINASLGCVSHRTIAPVENDIFFLSHRGVFVLGHEPNIAIDVLRTNETSVKVRGFFEGLTPTEKKNAAAGYYKNQYIVTIPGKNQAIAFDRERLAWMGPWSQDARIFTRYFDPNDKEGFLAGKDDAAEVVEYNEDFEGDQGAAIDTILKTKRTDFGDWTLFKNIGNVFMNFKNAAGSIGIDFKLEDRAGDLVTAKSSTVTIGSVEGQSGWGADLWANTLWGNSESKASPPDTDDFVKEFKINKPGRNFQIVISTDSVVDGYELLGIQSRAKTVGRGLKGDTWATN